VTDSVNPETIIGDFHTLSEGLREQKYSPRELSLGTRIGRYEILSHIGQGGFSSIYQARHIYLDQMVALKTLRASATSREDAGRYLREARSLAVLNHPNAVRAYDADIENGIPYIILEFIEGLNVRNLIKTKGQFSLNRAMDLLEDIGGVLLRQEQIGIIHRDIKPDNIVRRRDGSFCLVDYGVVEFDRNSSIRAFSDEFVQHVTPPGGMCGTLAYMAPEQATGTTTHKTDLFSLGLTVWECLVGRPAHTNISISNLLDIISKPIPPVSAMRKDVPEGLNCIINGLLAIDQTQRYNSASVLLEELELFRYRKAKPFGPLRGSVFVAIPFKKRFLKVFKAIEQACAKERLKARRMDQAIFVNEIWNQTVQEIEASLIIIADFTGVGLRKIPNPNVVTEASHARAINKPLLLITQDDPDKLPFDWKQVPVIRYRSNQNGLVDLTDNIVAKCRHLRLSV
jgi:serine/threonine protein kinase